MQDLRAIFRAGGPLVEALPGAQFGATYGRAINAPQQHVWDAVQALRWRDLRRSGPLLTIRMGRTLSGAQQRVVDGPVPLVPLLSDPPNVWVGGMIGRPWQPIPEPSHLPTSLDDLRAYGEPGWLKYGMDFVVSPLGGHRTYLETTTLCQATDEAARRKFSRYWFVIHAFSGVIRRDLLASADRAAVARG